ncbi:DinB family protein [Roseisolibacter sp. H3M3-2]|uniref:DinB family protein n=1 Tax=Roseisolibacter sp. H3M3-2 TaxID=3031323 RepID=UPI0023D9FFF3|nr:DinB family protein [Roseisolibacter sp. H3M3-2]MDF1506044.1 DinB family protein [Roseisolibacter sp. H3M3-2]
MTTPAAEPDPLLALLVEERAAFLAAVDRVPADRRAERPAPDRWSALEVAEHVARIDAGVARMLATYAEQPAVDPEACEAAVLGERRAGWVRARNERVEAPERVRPAGGLAEDAVREQMARAREALVAAYRAATPDVLDRRVHPHPFIGPVTLRGWIELAAHHDARHAKQVDEVAAQLAGRPA